MDRSFFWRRIVAEKQKEHIHAKQRFWSDDLTWWKSCWAPWQLHQKKSMHQGIGGISLWIWIWQPTKYVSYVYIYICICDIFVWLFCILLSGMSWTHKAQIAKRIQSPAERNGIGNTYHNYHSCFHLMRDHNALIQWLALEISKHVEKIISNSFSAMQIPEYIFHDSQLKTYPRCIQQLLHFVNVWLTSTCWTLVEPFLWKHWTLFPSILEFLVMNSI